MLAQVPQGVILKGTNSSALVLKLPVAVDCVFLLIYCRLPHFEFGFHHKNIVEPYHYYIVQVRCVCAPVPV